MLPLSCSRGLSRGPVGVLACSTDRPSYYAPCTGIMSSMTNPVPAVAPTQNDLPPVYVPPADATDSSGNVTDSRVSRETLSSLAEDASTVRDDVEGIKTDAKDAIEHLVKFAHFPTENLQRFVVSALHNLIDRVL